MNDRVLLSKFRNLVEAETLKKLFARKKKQTQVPEVHQKSDDPLFYCLLCAKFLRFSELIDGCRCCHCDNELFLVPHDELKKEHLPPDAEPSAL